MSDPARHHRHAATFYGSVESLVFTVSTYLKEGLDAGEPAVVIATADHRAAIEAALAESFVDVAAARRAGDLVVIDAEDLMGTFMIGAMPDAGAFEEIIGATMRQVQRGRARKPIRAYGEMVNVLWQRGDAKAAIEIEVLWNKLAGSVDFSLLCGYAMRNFFTHAEGLRDVCRLHTHVSHTDLAVSHPTIH